jgi:hypothetical protein
MQYLKALVIGMGILIVLGMALLVYGFASKSQNKSQNPANAVSMPGTAMSEFGDIMLNLPEQCQTKNIIANNHQLIIELGSKITSGNSSDCNKILILDLSTGKTLGSINLHQ